jgi:hypothetical protein
MRPRRLEWPAGAQVAPVALTAGPKEVAFARGSVLALAFNGSPRDIQTQFRAPDRPAVFHGAADESPL